MTDFTQSLINDCHKRLIELDNERDEIKKLMKLLGYKKPRKSKPRKAGTMPELDAHRKTRLSVVTTTPLTKDESRALVAGDVSVAGQT